MAHSYNDGNSEPPVCDAITLAMHSTHVFPYLPNHRSSCFRHHQHQQREYWVSTSESATEPIASSKGASSSPCPVHFLGDAEGCHDDRKPAMCCIGWTRCENPDSSLNDTRLTVQCADRSSSLCCLLQSSQCALTKCHRHLLGNPRMTLADQEIVPVFDSIRCSYRRNSQDIEEASSVYHCLESRECETCIRGEPFFHSQRHICDFPHEQNDNGTRNNPDKRHQTQSHRRNCTRLFVGCSTGTLVDLGSHHSVSGPGMFARLTSGSFNRALSLSWIRNLFVYVIVLGILSQMCCEAGPIPRDGNKVYLSQGSLMYRKERSLLPHVQPSRRRRSSGVSPTTSAANDTSDPVHSSPRGSNSTSLSSSPISSDIPMETEPSPYPKSPEFLIPKDLEQEKLLALLVATLQRLNFLQDENSSGVSRCFLIVHNTSQQEDVKITSSRSDKVIEITISLSIHPSSLPGENGTSPGTNETSGGESAVLPTFCLDNTFVEISLGKEKKKGGGAATAATSATHNTGADGKKGTGGIYGVLHSGSEYQNIMFYSGSEYQNIMLHSGSEYQNIMFYSGSEYQNIMFYSGSEYQNIMLPPAVSIRI